MVKEKNIYICIIKIMFLKYVMVGKINMKYNEFLF